MAALPSPTTRDMEAFGIWLLVNQELPGVALLYDHYKNTSGQQRTGHFKQAFATVYRFLAEHPNIRQQLSTELDDLANDDGILDLQNHAILEHWVKHVQTHASDRGAIWDYSIFRRQQPSSLGGTGDEQPRSRGGGGSGTLQRMLPVLARYMTEKRLP